MFTKIGKTFNARQAADAGTAVEIALQSVIEDLPQQPWEFRELDDREYWVLTKRNERSFATKLDLLDGLSPVTVAELETRFKSAQEEMIRNSLSHRASEALGDITLNGKKALIYTFRAPARVVSTASDFTTERFVSLRALLAERVEGLQEKLETRRKVKAVAKTVDAARIQNGSKFSVMEELKELKNWAVGTIKGKKSSGTPDAEIPIELLTRKFSLS